MSNKINLITWDDTKTQQEILKRYTNSSDSRKYYENGWRYNERLLYSIKNSRSVSSQLDSLYSLPEIDSSNADMTVSYLMKNFRFLHAQMSSNPPDVVMKPATSDQANARRAEAADKVVRWASKNYKLQEKVDQTSLNTLLYGSGILKTVWDAAAGEIVDFNKETGELELEGDIDISVPFIWNLFIDPDARSIDKVKWVLEEIYLDYDEACLRWTGPDNEKKLQSAKTVGQGEGQNGNITYKDNTTTSRSYNVVKLLEYWETGLPTNGYLGRYCITTPNGQVLTSCKPNPFRFRSGGAVWDIENSDLTDDEKKAKIDTLPERARLPYHFLTDIDVPNAVYGKSFVDYTAPLQETLAKLDTAVLDAIQAHGVARLIISEESEITQMGNSNWDVTKVAGGPATGPYFMKNPDLMPEMATTRQNLVTGINDVSGVNESMFGQQSRETAGTAMQYATNQGNMIRRRLFNKYVLFTEALYVSILDLVRTNWTTSRTLHVLGKEHALEAVDIQGIDVDGGYDVVGDYGTSLSLDPTQRKQELVMLQPLLEKAGITPRRVLELMKLSDLGSAYDDIKLADLRQAEIFEKMSSLFSAGVPQMECYIPPKKYMDNENMIAYAFRYFMTSEYQNLPDEVQALCEKHVDERAQLAAQMQSVGGQPGTPPGPPPGLPMSAAGPGPAGVTPTPASEAAPGAPPPGIMK